MTGRETTGHERNGIKELNTPVPRAVLIFLAATATFAVLSTGWAMLLAGIIVGGLFAAFSFAISAFSVPMLLDEKSDAFTAMGTSMALVWNNLPVMLAWGAIVVALFLLSAVTGLLALIVVFPLLGHATWQAYKAVR